MFVINGTAELKSINLRAEAHGDEIVRAMDIKLLAVDVDAARLDSAIPDMDRLWDGDQPVLQEVYPVKVRHKLENMKVTMDELPKDFDCTVDRIEITPKHAKRCDVLLTLKVSHVQDGFLDKLHAALRSQVTLDIVERQLELPEMEQAKG